MALMMFVVSTFIVPMLMNKTTEVTFEWLKPYLRQCWTAVFAFYSIALLVMSEAVRKEAMNTHKSVQGWKGYTVAAMTGAVILCGYWWFTGKVLPHSESPPPADQKTKENQTAALPSSPTPTPASVPLPIPHPHTPKEQPSNQAVSQTLNQPPAARRPPRFRLNQMSVAKFSEPATGSILSLGLENVGETPAHGIEIQVAMLPSAGYRAPVVATTVVKDDIEPNMIFVSRFPVAIRVGVGEQIIRIWMRYRDLEHPDPPIVQVVFRVWAGNGGGTPSAQFSLLDGQYHSDFEKYFDREVPTPP